MSTETERRRPIKMYRVVVAHGPYRVGDKIQPTGMYRDVLLRRKVIEEVKDEEPIVEREAKPELDRMVPTREGGQQGSLLTRGKRGR